jgi:hypothetical protein
MKIKLGDLVKSNDYVDSSVYLFGMVVGFHEDFIHDDSPCRPFKIEWLHKEKGWAYYGDFWYDDELELVE